MFNTLVWTGYRSICACLVKTIQRFGIAIVLSHVQKVSFEHARCGWKTFENWEKCSVLRQKRTREDVAAVFRSQILAATMSAFVRSILTSLGKISSAQISVLCPWFFLVWFRYFRKWQLIRSLQFGFCVDCDLSWTGKTWTDEENVWSIERFSLASESNVIGICFGFPLPRFVIGLNISRHSIIQSEVKPKPIVTHSRMFSRPLCFSPVFVSYMYLFEFWLVHRTVRVTCDWPEWLRWLWFYYT